jgi:hypothetical protein
VNLIGHAPGAFYRPVRVDDTARRRYKKNSANGDNGPHPLHWVNLLLGVPGESF